MVAGPGLHQGPPVHVRPVLPVLRRRAGQGHLPEARPGLRPHAPTRARSASAASPTTTRPRRSSPARRRSSSRYMSQVYSCCHNGAGMAFDSKGNLYITNGDRRRTAPRQRREQPVQQQRRLHQPGPALHAPVPAATGADDRTAATWPRPISARRLRPLISATATPAARRATRTSTRARSSASTRWRTRATRRASGRRTRSRTPAPPTARTCSRPTASAVKDGKAKPEIFAMGVRSNYTIHIDTKTDAITTAWIGPDQGTEIADLGPGQDRERHDDELGGQLGLAVLPGRQPLGLPREVGRRHRRRPRPTCRLTARPGTVGGGADGQTGGVLRLPRPVIERLAVQHGPHDAPRAEAGEHLVRPAGRLLRLPEERQRRRHLHQLPTHGQYDGDHDGISRCCPWIIGGSQAPIDGGIYRKPAGDKPDAWPSYWDGRWFLIDFANTQRRASRAADGPGDAVQGRPAGRGGLAAAASSRPR